MLRSGRLEAGSRVLASTRYVVLRKKISLFCGAYEPVCVTASVTPGARTTTRAAVPADLDPGNPGYDRSAQSGHSVQTSASVSHAQPQGGGRHRQGRLDPQCRRGRGSGLLTHSPSNLPRRRIRLSLRQLFRSVSRDSQLCPRHASPAWRLDCLARPRWHRPQRQAAFVLQLGDHGPGSTGLSRRLLERARPPALLSLHPRAVASAATSTLRRDVRQEPLRRAHECVFGVLALESESVDPRL